MSQTQNPTPTTSTTEPELYADTNISMKSGRLTKDAELTTGDKFVRLRLANNKQYKSGDEIKSITNYFTILVSRNLNEAFETAKSLQKGDWAYIKGEDATKSFDTAEGYKQTAVTTYAWKVTVKNTEPETGAQTA